MNWTREKLTIAIGQRICVGFTGTTVPPELRELIQKYKVGNILLFSRNVESFEQLKALCTDLRELILSETGLPPFIMIAAFLVDHDERLIQHEHQRHDMQR